MSSLLDVTDLHTFIGQFHILQGVTVEVPANSITVLLGRNGAGKTTTLRSIMGLNPPTRGAIHYAGQPIAGRRAYDIAQLGIGYVPDYRAIFKQLTVEENLKIAERAKGELARKREWLFGIFPDLAAPVPVAWGAVVRRPAADAGGGARPGARQPPAPH